MRIQFKTGLILGSLLIVGLLSGTIFIAQWIIGQRAADDVASTIFETTATKVQAQVDNLISIPLKLAGTLAHNHGIETPKGNGLDTPVRHQIFNILHHQTSLYSIYVGSEDGGFYQIIAVRGDKAVKAKHKAPEQTEWIVRTIYTNDLNKRVQSWSFLDEGQQLLQTVEEDAPDYDPRKRPWYAAAKSATGTVLSDVYVFNSLQQPGITASHDLMDKGGVVGIDMTLSQLSNFVSDQSLSDNGLVFIYDKKNRVIALPKQIEGVAFLSDIQKVPSETIQSVFSADASPAYYAKSLNLIQDGPGFKLGIAAPVSDFTSSYRDMQQKVVILIIGFLVVFVPVIMYVSQRLARRVTDLAEDAKKIQNRDFSHRDKSQTRIIELAELENSFADMREALFAAEKLNEEQQRQQKDKIQRQIQREQYIVEFEEQLGAVFSGLDAADRSMKDTAYDMQGIAQHTKEQSASVSVSAEVTSNNVEAVACAAEELSASIGEIATQVTSATQSAMQAVHQTTDTSNKIRILEDNVAQISEFVVMINDIAEQTNMLALNATIEAARAGSSGKGFAVVAGEVKGLANQTSQATQEIAKQIKLIQTATHASVEAIDSVSDTIADVQTISSSISAAMEQQRATTSEIAQNMEQAASETHNVFSEIKTLQETADRSETASSHINAAANDLSSQGDILRNTVKEFLARVHSTSNITKAG